jgi:alpha-galactosidase
VVVATTPRKRVAVLYQDTVINPGTQLPDTVLVVNGTLEKRIILELTEDAGERHVTIRNCQGQVVQEEVRTIKQGLHSFTVPAAGVLVLQGAASI